MTCVGHTQSIIMLIQVVLEAPSHCPPWLIEQITIDSPTLGHTHQFPCGRGLSPGSEVILEELSNTGSSSLTVSTHTHTQPLTGECYHITLGMCPHWSVVVVGTNHLLALLYHTLDYKQFVRLK